MDGVGDIIMMNTDNQLFQHHKITYVRQCIFVSDL